jgi:uncharacterized protein YvpB
MKLTIITNTVFKQAPVQSVELPENEKVNVAAGKEFKVQAYLEMGDHLKVTLLEDSLKGRNTWTVFKSHVELIGDDGQKLVGKYTSGDKLPEKVNLPVAWFSQRDNEFDPQGTCNVTCVAMCLYYYGIRPTNPKEQLENELFELVAQKGWDYHVHEHLRRVFIEYGVFDTFKVDASLNEIKTHLANKNPVVLPGMFTESGHIIVLRGYDETGFLVNDPYGEFFYSGYQDKSGENLHYSYKLVQEKCMDTLEQYWAHFPEKR